MRTSVDAALAGSRGRSRAISESWREQALERGRLLSDLGEDTSRVRELSRRHVSPLRRAPGRSRGRRRARRCRRGCRVRAGRCRGSPRTRAGTAEAASAARSRGTPSSTRFRTASIIVSALPARTPSSRRATPSRTSTSTSPSGYVAVAEPRTGDRVGHEREAAGGDPPEQAHRRRDRGGRRPRSPGRTTSERTSAAPTMPGSRCESGRIALKTCVTVRTPRSNAACASAAVASLWPSETDDAARLQEVDQLERAGKLGCERQESAPGRPRAGDRAARDRDRGGSRADGCRAAPRRGTALRGARRGCAAHGARAGTARRAATRSSSSEVMNVGR